MRGLSGASLRSREAWSREREREEFRGEAPLSVSWPGLDPGLEASGDGEEDSFRGEEAEAEEMRGRLLGGSGGLGLVSAETACC